MDAPMATTTSGRSADAPVGLLHKRSPSGKHRVQRPRLAISIACRGLFLLLFSLPLSEGRGVPGDGQKEVVAIVLDCRQLIVVLTPKSKSISTIQVAGNVTCSPEEWPQDKKLQLTQDLIIRGTPIDGSKEMPVLDFGGAENVIEVPAGVELILEELAVLQDQISTHAGSDYGVGFQLDFADTKEGGRLKFRHAFVGGRECKDGKSMDELAELFWNSSNEVPTGIKACNTVVVCGEGMQALVEGGMNEATSGCERTAETEEEKGGNRSISVTVVSAITGMLALVVVFILVVTIVKWNRGKRNRNPPAQTSPRSSLNMSIEEDMQMMETPDIEAHEDSTPRHINPPLAFAPDDGLTLDMEWLLGKGSTSRVHKGTYLGYTVAVRVTEQAGSLEGASKTPREVRINRRMSHPNIVKTVFSGAFFNGNGAGEKRDSDTASSSCPSLLSSTPSLNYSTFIVMEFCDVGNLQNAMSKGMFVEVDDVGGSKLDLKLALMCMLDVARAMEHMHEQNVVHAALHPRNILLKLDESDERGFTCKVGNFAWSRKMPAHLPSMKTNSFSDMAVTPPEMLKDGDLSLKADVYSFGITLWTLVSQKVPYNDMLCKDIRTMVINEGRPKIPLYIPHILTELICRCWAQDPASRPSFKEIAADLTSMSTKFEHAANRNVDKHLESMKLDQDSTCVHDDGESSSHRYLRIRFDPSLADGNQPERNPSDIFRAVWAGAHSNRFSDAGATSPESNEPPESILASLESLGRRPSRRASQVKAHEAFVRAVDEMIHRSNRDSSETSLRQFLDALNVHVRR
ncbi:hypothetical protein BSKO_08653 [Bryopsis sp. KO-2023]|nr:hypothetical protein BSKO_08653 [Bryopsis sp. KO-2023]